MRHQIIDGSGFLALVNAEKYASFVDNDWSLTQLFDHFLSEMNENSLIIWSTGFANNWSADFLKASSDTLPFREFSKLIEVTGGCIYLTNYEDLTMAAQFEDKKIPSSHNSDLRIDLENGFYKVTVRQVSDPDSDIVFDEETNFEIILQKIDTENEEKPANIFWLF
ncbi:hypothetical protein BEL04_06625 [Mucilaginibacter sp. PPCGB 2223]|nr:hypothetical protein BEL04_06625 [Mucilaginibacter sp. PPCGB 2223]